MQVASIGEGSFGQLFPAAMVFPGISGYRGDLEDVLNLSRAAFDLMEPKAVEKIRWVEVRLMAPDAGTWVVSETVLGVSQRNRG